MLANYLIGLREGLEAALVVSILVAYLVKNGKRDLLSQVWVGVGVAVAVSVAFGALLTFGPQGLSHEAQEAIGGTLSIAAVALVTWMILWMARTARFLKSNLQHKLDAAIEAGPVAVAVMALLAVGREGLETTLFLWSAAKATTSATSTGSSVPLVGALAGLATAVLLGWLMYRGALKLNLQVFFAWTGIFLVLVAAGVLSYGVHDLQEAAILPGIHTLAFDVSSTIPPGSWYGTFLKGVFNFSPATTWLGAIAWVGYVTVVLSLFIRTVWFTAPRPSPARALDATPVTAGGSR